MVAQSLQTVCVMGKNLNSNFLKFGPTWPQYRCAGIACAKEEKLLFSKVRHGTDPRPTESSILVIADTNWWKVLHTCLF